MAGIHNNHEEFEKEEAEALIQKWKDLIIGRTHKVGAEILSYKSIELKQVEGSVKYNILVWSGLNHLSDLRDVIQRDEELRTKKFLGE